MYTHQKLKARVLIMKVEFECTTRNQALSNIYLFVFQKQKKDLDQESSITPKKRKAPEPSPDVTPVKSQKRNTPLKKKQKYEAESPLSTPQKADSSVKLVRFHDAEIEIIEDIKQPQKTSKKPDLEKICEDDDDEETLEAFSVIRFFFF